MSELSLVLNSRLQANELTANLLMLTPVGGIPPENDQLLIGTPGAALTWSVHRCFFRFEMFSQTICSRLRPSGRLSSEGEQGAVRRITEAILGSLSLPHTTKTTPGNIRDPKCHQESVGKLYFVPHKLFVLIQFNKLGYVLIIF